MPIYKALYLVNRDQLNALSGPVRSEDGEFWESAIGALNELGESGWEFLIPVYVPLFGRDHAGQCLESILVVNRSGTAAQDIQRRVERTKSLIAITEKKAATATGMQATSHVVTIKELTELLARLESRLRAAEE